MKSTSQISEGSKKGNGAVKPERFKSVIPFDPVRIILHVAKGWFWILLAGTLGGAAAFQFADQKLDSKYTAQVQVVRREAQSALQATEMGESFQPREFNAATISAMMRSGDLLERVGSGLDPAMSIKEMQEALVIRPEKNTDLISVAFTSNVSASVAAQAINNYAGEVVELTRELQGQEARELHAFITMQVERLEAEIDEAQEELVVFSRKSGLYHAEKEIEALLAQLADLDLKIEMTRIDRGTVDYRLAQAEKELGKQDPALQSLALGRERLAELGSQFTDQHPEMVEQRAKVAMLEKAAENRVKDVTESFRSTGNTVANNLYLELITLRGKRERYDLELEKLTAFRNERELVLQAIPDKSLEYIRLQGKVGMLEEARGLLRGRQREAGLFAEKALGYYRLFTPASSETVEVSGPAKKLLAFTGLAAVLAGGLVMAWRVLRALRFDGISSPGDLRRMTSRQVVAMLPPEDLMSDDDLVRWRFSTWWSLHQQLPRVDDGAFVIGFLSASSGEGKTTWQHHLARAARERGQKVLMVSDASSDAEDTVAIEEALATPEEVKKHLARVGALEVMTPADWKWTADRRADWEQALACWQIERDLVIFVELPPATRLDSLLLAETLPSTIWLSEAKRKGKRDSAALIRTLHESGVQLVGAVLNRVAPVYRRMPDLARFGLCAAASLLLAPALPAQEIEEALPLPAAGELTIEEPVVPIVDQGDLPTPSPKLSPWQERLTLGAGDILNLKVYGHQKYNRTEVPVAPDGTISYLQVHDFKASGLTVDELREGLTEALSAYIKNARVIVIPQKFRSKKYFLMGTVLDRGAYSLDRPMTLVEAVARARGISTGLREKSTVEIADMKRAFVVRNGKKLKVDFTKLFYEGDVSQNIQLSPGDYVYLPSNVVNEVYVLGSVDSPGQTGVTDSLTALGAITIRGGFSQDAWRKKVLVIRNSLSPNRQVFVVDTAAVIAGKARDIVLEPRDLVFVCSRPWSRAEEVTDIAIRSFVQGATSTWTGLNVKTLIK